MTVEIRRGTLRFVEREPGRLTHHAFSFGPHYDPERLAFGPMVCHDEHLLGPGRGFDTHRHSGLDIVSWVVSGALSHTDSSGATTVLEPGSVGVLSTGDGIEHSEHATADGPCRFVQVWLRSSSPAASYGVTPVPPGRGLVRAVEVGGSALAVARLEAGEALALPRADLVHAYVATGALTRSSLAEPLAAGDAFLVSDRAVSDPELVVTAGVPTELLVWTLG